MVEATKLEVVSVPVGDIVDGLDVEGFFNFGVGRYEQMKDDYRRDQRIEENICSILALSMMPGSRRSTKKLHIDGRATVSLDVSSKSST